MHKIFISRYIDKALAIGLLLIVLMVGYVLIKYVYLQQSNNLSLVIELRKNKNAKVSSILANEKKLRDEIDQQKIAIKKNKIFLNSNKPVFVSALRSCRPLRFRRKVGLRGTQKTPSQFSHLIGRKIIYYYMRCDVGIFNY